MRLLDHARRQPQRRARERAAVRRDPPAERRARADQQRPARRSPASSTCRRSTTSSATRSTRSSTPRSSSSSMLDETTGLMPLPVLDRARRALAGGADALPTASRKHVLETREPLMIIEDVRRSGRASRHPTSWSGEPPKSVAVRAAGRRRQRDRRDLAPERRPGARLHRLRRAPARRRSPAASASRSRTRACSTRPASATPSSR